MKPAKPTDFENLLKGFKIDVSDDAVSFTFKMPKSTNYKKINPKNLPMIIPEKYRFSNDDHQELENDQVIRDAYMGDSIEEERDISFLTEPEEFDMIEEVLDPFRVKISFKAYIKIALHSLKYAHPNTPQPTWVEVIGLMTGYIENSDDPKKTCINIQDAHPIGHGNAVTAQIQDPNSVVKVYQEKDKGHSILGWYHSHPSYTPFMSNTDYNTQVRYQKLAKAPLLHQPVALVIDPTEISKTNYGFKIFRLQEDYKTWDEPKFQVVDAPVATMPEMIQTLLPLTTGRAVFLEYE